MPADRPGTSETCRSAGPNAADRDRIVDRVRKLMAFNDRTATEAEVENAMALAARLMEQHAIDRSELEDQPDAATVARTRDRSPLRSNVARWEATLAAAVREAVPGASYYTDTDDADLARGLGRRSFVTWYGPADAVAVARMLFDETRLIIATLAGRLYGGCYRGHGRSYAEGFAVALWRRMKHERAASAQHDRITAIVCLEDDRNRAWLAKEHAVRLVSRTRPRGGRHFSNAYEHGQRDGAMHEFTGIRPRIDDPPAGRLPGH